MGMHNLFASKFHHLPVSCSVIAGVKIDRIFMPALVIRIRS